MKGHRHGLKFGLAALLAVVLLPLAIAAEEESAAGEAATDKPPPLMRQKLDAMHGALEGIATRDFRMIRDSGDLLQRISVIDQWLKYPDTEYGQMTQDFRRAVENMIMSADTENLEGATLYFQKVTTSCLECHNFMRESGRH